MSALLYRNTHSGSALVYRETNYTAPVGDTTAPNLTVPTASATSSTSANGTVTTDEANGTLYYLINGNATATAAQVEAGGSKTVTAAGVQTVSVTGLPSDSTLYPHYVHVDAAGNVSSVANGGSFITPPANSSVDFSKISATRTVNFGGGTNRVDFDGGTNRVNFDGGTTKVDF